MSVSCQPAIRRRWLDALCTNLPTSHHQACRHTTSAHLTLSRSPLSPSRLISPAVPTLVSSRTRLLSSSSSASASTVSQPSASVDSLEDVLGDSLLNWYPGHMHKTFKALDAQIKHCNVVVEVRDARVSTRTPRTQPTQTRGTVSTNAD